MMTKSMVDLFAPKSVGWRAAAVIAFSCLLANLAVAVDEPIELLHADRLTYSGSGVDMVTNLEGNVRLRHGHTELSAHRATWYRRPELVVFTDSVVMIDAQRSLRCQNLTYYRELNSATATGNVVITDQAEKLVLRSGLAEYSAQQKRFVAVGAPEMQLGSPDDSAQTEIRADSIIYDFDQKKGFVRGHATITRRDITATAESGSFLDGGALIVLEGNPVAKQGENTLSGDVMKIHTEKRALIRMVVEGNCGAIYRDRPKKPDEKPTEAKLTGKSLEVFFEQDKPIKAVMKKNATSYYTPSPSDTAVTGRNVASGDSITLFFADSRINRVQVLGGARGSYIEEKRSAKPSAAPETTHYEAQSIDYLVDNNLIELSGEAGLRYRGLHLKSGRVRFDTRQEILVAEGISQKTDSGEVVVDKPVLVDGQQQLWGGRMAYNIRTGRGKVELGRTQFEQGFYSGRRLRRVEEDILYVSDGEYTSCPIDTPHYHFYCRKMKLVAQDKIIARPVVMYLGPVPVAILPYYVFPIRKGRHSGFLTFELGSFQKGERYIRKLGYYWAPSDYWDAQAGVDIYENDRVIINSRVNYALRYRLSGNIGGSFTRQSRWQNYQRHVNLRWGVNFSHNQIFSPSLTLRAAGSFLSDKSYNLDNNYDPQERLNRTIRSSASLGQRWKSSSLSLAFDQSWNLDTDTKTQLLPSISFTRNPLPIIPQARLSSDRQRRRLPWEEKPAEKPPRWYNSILLSIRSDFQNRRNQTTKSGLLDWNAFQTLNTSLAISAPQKVMEVLTLNLSANLVQSVYRIDRLHRADTTDLVTDDFFRREVWSATMSAATTLYGTVFPRLGWLNGLRHVMTPSLAYQYSPKFSRHKEYQRYTGVGPASSTRVRALSLSLRNLFQAKFGRPGNEVKYDLFNLDFSTGYDFEAKARRWRKLSTAVNSTALKLVTFSGSASHDFYDPITGEARFLKPWLESISLSSSMVKVFRLGAAPPSPDSATDEKSDLTERSARQRSPAGDSPSFGLNLSYRYSETRFLGRRTITRWVDATCQFRFTKSWEVKYDIHYDMTAKRASSQNLKLTRDLHCWQGEFVWVPTGPLAGYYFRIYIKQHPDIKIEQSRGGVRGGYY